MIEFRDYARPGTLTSRAFSTMTMGRRADSCLRRHEVSLEPKNDRRGVHTGWWATILAIVMGCCAFPASAVTIADDYASLLRERTEITRLDGDDMFGDSIGLYTGSIEFLHTDVSIPGNNGLEVGIKRRLNLTSARGSIGFSDWELAIPNMHGVFSKYGWKGNDPDRSKRCTGFGEPPYERADPQSPNIPEMLISGREFWHGTYLYLPSSGDEEVLKAWPEHVKPTNSYTYALRTKGGAAIRCIPMGSGTEEGFEVLTPDGVTYRLDHMVSRSDEPLLKSTLNPPLGFDGIYFLQRNEYYLYPTSARDRFGNTVTYTWSATNPSRLTKIASSDGRIIDIIYYDDERNKNKIRYVKHGLRTWEYLYENDAKLSSVVLPDTTSWQFETFSAWNGPAEDSHCGFEGTRSGGAPSVSMAHPSGAKAVFSMQSALHGRSSSAYSCSSSLSEYQSISYENYPAEYFMWSIRSKTISGPGIQSPLIWTYTYGPANGCYTNTDIGNIRCTATSAKTKWLDVKDPSGVSTRYTFGNELNVNEGNLLSVASPGQTISHSYHWLSPGPYPAAAGSTGQGRGFNFANRVITLRERTINRDGVDFTWRANAFDIFARPVSVTKFSTLPGNPAKTEVTAYHDDTALWALSQVASVKCTVSVPASAACNGDAVTQTDYGWKALPWKTYRFGKLQQTLEYRLDGTLRSVADGRDSVTELSGFKRGIPQRIDYPITPDQPSGSARSALVNDDGTIESVTDENGYRTCYEYDAMGRLAKVTHPSESTSGVCNNGTWAITARTVTQSSSARYGLPAGHWVQVTSIGDGRKTVDYDALWRPVVETTYDAADISGTRSIVVKRYDAAGRLAFQSYPVASLTNYADTALQGTRYIYDALDRPTQVTQNWENEAELGPLTTTTAYLSNPNGYYTRVTNPGGLVTYTFYQAFDQPSYDAPIAISNSGSQYTDITRDPFGKPIAITRRNYGGTVSATRHYAYNGAQELCRMIEPETGATIMGYDAAGNLKWSAAGLPTTLACDPEGDHSAIAPRRVDRGYDTRNRLRTISFPDDIGDTVYHYTPDSLLDSVLVDNGSGNVVRTSYGYNRRRLLASERMEWGSIDWSLTYGYDGNGHPDALGYPDGTSIDFAPDALGRPTRAGTYATGATYHPNGMLAGFRYGNAMERMVALNDRGQPAHIRDAYEGATNPAIAIDEYYDYGPNGNVLAITDGVSSRGNRDMEYDDLDRLTAVTSPMFGTASYGYDVLDNLHWTKVSGGRQPRTYYYCYNDKQQLAFIRSASACLGNTPSPALLALEYDVQGNLKERDNVSYTFDFGNRLRSVNSPTTSYVYDGHGRRVRDVTGASKYSLYSQSGALMFVSDLRTGKQVRNVYLGNTLVAELEKDTATGAITNRYLHTDALGSVAARSSQGRGSVLRNEYEPYGAFSNRDSYDRPGYTGHVMDAATGLVYMQQRYYDPMIGRFLSVDPVTAYSSPGANFNRYWYANNNPYKFFDPDGRQVAMDRDLSASEEKKKQRERVMELGATGAAGALGQKGNVWRPLGQIIGNGLRAAGLTAATAAAGAGAAAMAYSADLGVDREYPSYTFYHGTSPQSAVAFLAGMPLSASAAAANRTHGQLGFYLATDMYSAEVFGFYKAANPSVLRYSIRAPAFNQLLGQGAYLQPIPQGGFREAPPGQELFIPPSAFPLFNQLRWSGEIFVTPTGN
jgi:RHS repeat-associated protein